ncbi:alpha/beta fold hydrolase [Cryobacterium sp. Y62]|uniref:alpha/beta fold hydrolase n=1 Tax=Cryobacterium sp. Y62 TaxID=2048284 RepID=UPI0011B09602|nr:alpha/beta hydrolase [Cryobacterium sp. Y62]
MTTGDEDSTTTPSVPAARPTKTSRQPEPSSATGLTELELDNCGHSPHLEHPAEFLATLLAQLER